MEYIIIVYSAITIKITIIEINKYHKNNKINYTHHYLLCFFCMKIPHQNQLLYM